MSLIVTAYTQEGIVRRCRQLYYNKFHTRRKKNYINIAIVGINYSC